MNPADLLRRGARRALRAAVKAAPPAAATRALAQWEARRATAAERDASAMAPSSGGDRGSAIVLAADALVASYRRSLALAAEAVSEEGLSVSVLRCRGALGACISKRFSGMVASVTPDRPDGVCAQCALAGALEPFPGSAAPLWIESLVDADQVGRDAAMIAALPADRLAELHVDELPAGPICASELLHNLRVLSYDPRDAGHEATMRAKLAAAIRSLRATQALLRAGGVRVLVHFSDYSHHLVPAMAARREGVRIVNLTHPALFNVSARLLIALPRTTLEHCYEMVRAWPRCAERPLPPERVDLIARDQLYRMTGGGSHIFSPVRGAAPAALRERLGIDAGRPVVAAFTSSPDELNSLELWSHAVGIDLGAVPDPFATQVEWLDATAAELASLPSRPVLVVRIHPREGSRGGREAQSEHLRLLRSHLDGRADVRVIWPDDHVSSYDLGEIATCIVTSWSSLGQEFARAGAEVVRAFGMKVPIPLGVFSRYAETPEGYGRALCEALEAPPSLRAVRLAYRWHNMEYLGSALDPAARSGGPWPGRVALRDLIAGRREVMDASLDALPAAEDGGAEAAETRALDVALRRLLAVVMGLAAPDPDTMRIDAPSTGADDPSLAALREEDPRLEGGGAVVWRIGGATARRDSPLARRLALLVSQCGAASGGDVFTRPAAPTAPGTSTIIRGH